MASQDNKTVSKADPWMPRHNMKVLNPHLLKDFFHIKGIVILATLGLLLSGCAGAPDVRRSDRSSSLDHRIFRDGSTPAILAQAERRAQPSGRKILARARIMTVNNKEILPGSCWDYVNAAWTRAGYPAKKRQTTFKGGKKGPYARASKIKPGDWLYFINHSYNNVEHSAMFVDWSDKKRLQGYMLSYAGEQKREPARYKIYDLRSVYQVIRAAD